MVGQVIRKKLYDAATQGDATTFQQLLQEDPYLLDVVSFPCFRNLLHIATMYEQVTIVEEVLKINQHLAWSLDSQKSSPLHIAAARGTVEIASKLLSIAPEMCWLRDCHGMNPVHIAAMKGHVEMLEEIIRHEPLSAREKLDRGQTVLHLCVKHGQLRILDILASNLRGLASVEDDDGETILHLAVRYKQVEIVQLLAQHSRVDFQQSRNSKGKTALEVSLESPHDTTHAEIAKILKQEIKGIPVVIRLVKAVNERAMMVLIMIATTTFQASIYPPGGAWQDDSSTHKAGTPIMASIDPKKYEEFLSLNTVTFTWSVFTIVGLTFVPLWSDEIFTAIIWMGSMFSVACFGACFINCALALTPETRYNYFVLSPAISSCIIVLGTRPYVIYVAPKLAVGINKCVPYLHMVVAKLSLLVDKCVTFWRDRGN